MTAIKDAAAEFLGHKRIAVTGVSRSPENHGGNVVYNRLRDRGYDVFPVNPKAEEVEGDAAIRSTLDPRRHRGSGDRDEARVRRRNDARVRRARHRARLDAPRPWSRQRSERQRHTGVRTASP